MKPHWLRGENVVAILPAFQEERFIGNLVNQLKPHQKSGLLSQILVVNDGSTDKTEQIAKETGARIITLPRNRGKMNAVATGALVVKQMFGLKNTIILTLDAEIEHVEETQLKKMILPIVRGKADMVIGTNNYSSTGYSGQRAIRLSAIGGLFKKSPKSQAGTKLWRTIMPIGYGLEMFLNHLVRKKWTIADTQFVMRGRGARSGGWHHIIGEQVWATNNYLDMRAEIAKKFAGKHGKKQLALARQREREARRRMCNRVKKARIMARKMKYIVYT